MVIECRAARSAVDLGLRHFGGDLPAQPYRIRLAEGGGDVDSLTLAVIPEPVQKF